MESIFSKEIQDFMISKRAAMGLNQKEFAIKAFGDAKHQGWVCRIEQGRGITGKTVDRICTAFNLKIEVTEN